MCIRDRQINRPQNTSSLQRQRGDNSMQRQIAFIHISNSPVPPLRNIFSEHTNFYDQIVNFLIQNDNNNYGPPPAAKDALENLPLVKYSKAECQVGDCSVCKDEFNEEEPVRKMPCEHLFHNDCLVPWLKSHNSCPTCRFELPTDDQDYENLKASRTNSTAQRNSGNGPRNS
eukprot:TRINITY_DN2876_c0_g1_i12.p1 TRINITY_DN2876_c0_g1~~TRINITY_DN2876_c0_g1_i12.p1  ORF type:complete len:191 (+),score=31.09 TRINITY_DN2876_c0_g1_i12:60-575(+)